MKSATGRAVRYHLRVPLLAGAGRAELDALWRIVRKGKVDEVAFFVPHAEERSPGLGTLEECRRSVEFLGPVFERLRAQGVEPSINVWWTMSFSHFPSLPRSLRDRFSFRWAVSMTGRQSMSAACPLDRAWRDHVREIYGMFASLRPARLWIDDDVHAVLRADLHSPCFCRACLGEMRRRTGRRFTRRGLLKAVLADPPNQVREHWLEFQEELIRDLLSELAEAVHAASPSTSVSNMFSGIPYHWAEGRRWKEHVAALGTPAPYGRPPIGSYSEATALGIAQGLAEARLARAALPEGMPLAPEIENYPHTRFSKSVALAAAQMTMGQLFGMNEVTLSVYRFGGCLDLEREDIWERTLARLKGRLQAIAELDIRPEQFRGPALFFHQDVCRHVRGVADAPSPVMMLRKRPLDAALPLLGFATSYGRGPVTVLTAEEPHCLKQEELEGLFSGGVLLDARAADSLVRMGRGELAGLRGRIADAGASIETVEDEAFGAKRGEPMNIRWEGVPWQFELMAGARPISALRDYEGRKAGHAVVLYENHLGGRTAVYPYDSQASTTVFGSEAGAMLSPSFLSWARQTQMLAVLEWLGRAPVPLLVVGAPSVFAVLIQQDGRLVIGVANLLADPVDSLTLRLAAPGFRVTGARWLTRRRGWARLRAVPRTARGGIWMVRTGLRLGYLETAVVVLE